MGRKRNRDESEAPALYKVVRGCPCPVLAQGFRLREGKARLVAHGFLHLLKARQVPSPCVLGARWCGHVRHVRQGHDGVGSDSPLLQSTPVTTIGSAVVDNPSEHPELGLSVTRRPRRSSERSSNASCYAQHSCRPRQAPAAVSVLMGLGGRLF